MAILVIAAMIILRIQVRDAYAPFCILLCSAVGFAVPARAGFVNLGLHGQLVSGALAAVVALQHWRDHPWFGVCLAVICASLIGGLAGLIPLALKRLANVSEVISGVLLTSLLLILRNYVLRFRVQHQNETTISLDDYGQYYHVTLLVAALAVILAYVCVWGSGGWVLYIRA